MYETNMQCLFGLYAFDSRSQLPCYQGDSDRGLSKYHENRQGRRFCTIYPDVLGVCQRYKITVPIALTTHNVVGKY